MAHTQMLQTYQSHLSHLTNRYRINYLISPSKHDIILSNVHVTNIHVIVIQQNYVY